MTGSTKILTVSYGTFSCTLEGFDDPFGTMRGIAEYFRDLAADDRYFGAEPPTPDVEMLQRIAEKEVQRRVEARVGETAIALTQVTNGSDTEDTPTSETPQASEPEAPQAVREQQRADSRPSERVEISAESDERGPLTLDDDYLLADEPDDVLAVHPDARAPADGPAETVAEKLRRIRAVVSRSIEPEAEDGASFSEDQAPLADDAGSAQGRSRAQTRTIQQIAADLAEEDFAEDGEFENAQDGSSLTEPPAETHVEDATDADDIAGSDELVAETVEDADASGEDDGWAFDDTPDEADEVETDAEAMPLAEETPAADAGIEADDSVEESVSDTLSRVLARGAEDDDARNSDDSAAAEDASTEKRTSKPLAPLSEDDGDVGRLMAETDHQLQDDEGIRRRRVISQMRAAVAATKADRLASRRVTSRDIEEAEEQEPYRDALSEAVRDVSKPLPADSERKPSVAPLVLVSSQRVAQDDKVQEPAEAVPADTPEEETGDFAGFVESVGARELNELMEAAAAYASFVEGQTSFSRPEIMKRVARVDPALKLSREDGLRSFGQLLRQGTFRKLERGQFTIDESSRYRPHHRIAGE